MEAILVLITAGDEPEAVRIADALLAAHLVACVSRVPAIESQFWWQGERERTSEALLLAKTRRDLWPQVLEAIRSQHSYEVFEAIAIPIVEANPDYLRWIEETTSNDKANSE